MQLENLKTTIQSLKKHVLGYKRRHESEYAWDDYMMRSIFIDPRKYISEDQNTFKMISDIIIPNNVLIVEDIESNISKHITDTKRENYISPYPDGFETQPLNNKPYLVETHHDICDLERNLLLYAKITL